MTVQILDQETTYTTPEVPARMPLDVGGDLVSVYGGNFHALYHNKAWNTVYGEWAYWLTDDPDPTGIKYPGPGNFSDCTNYRVEAVVYSG